jgi:adenosine deaminase CECR1
MRHLVLLLALATSVFAAPFSARFEEIKRTAKPEELYTFLYALPKGGDLHNHLGGAIRSEWWYAVATDPTRNGGDTFYTRTKFTTGIDTGASLVLFQTIRQHTYDGLSDAAKADYQRLDALTPEQKQAWLDSVRLDRPGEGRREFFDWIWPRLGGLFGNQDVINNVTIETMKAYGAEGLHYLETQTSVMNYADNAGRPISSKDAADAIRRRLVQPDAIATGVTVRFQVTGLRFFADAEQQVERLYQFVDANRDLWVGINLAGIEENGKGYPLRFLETFREMRRKYPTLALSIHAGEMDGPDEHIRDTLLLGASRIGHGVNLIKDPDTLLLLQQSRRTLVEINLISNRLLEYTPDLSKNPFPEYLRTGIPVCLNTDDRGMWDSNLTDEYYTAVTTYNLSWDELISMGRNSLTFSFAQPEVKAKLLADYDAAVAAFEKQYANDLVPLKFVKPVTYGYAQRTWGFTFGP